MEAPVYLPDAALLAACRMESFHSHGPGGQHANRTDSAVRLTHVASGVVAQCQDHREHARNQAGALRRLRVRLAMEIRGQGRVDDLRTCLRGGRFTIGAQAEAFPAVIALVFDHLTTTAGDLAATAETLGCSTTQLAKLLHADKEVLQHANALRAAQGLGPIHGR